MSLPERPAQRVPPTTPLLPMRLRDPLRSNPILARLALLAALAATTLAAGTLAAAPASAQGVTTAALAGAVLDAAGEAIIGGTVVATHEPSGTVYRGVTRTDGRFNLPNLRVGGPYTVRATYTGYAASEQTGLQLQLGRTSEIELRLAESTSVLGEVTVSASVDPTLNADRTGAATTVSLDAIQALPTISRSTEDFTRLTPQASGNSFGGRNSLYNNFTLDGSVFNNPFGLDSPVPGGQANAQPVSLDAVEQVQVVLAPFDVRQAGFTGAGVNTVTRSGTNAYTATAYYFGRNEALIGSRVGEFEVRKPDLAFGQFGVSVGGPILRDRLFFFANVEAERRDDPWTNFAPARGTATGAGISRVTAADLDAIRARLISAYGYDPGEYEGFTNATDNNKFLLKLDANISASTSATLRVNVLDAARGLPPNQFAIAPPGGRGPDQNSIPFQNAGYRINNDIYSGVAEVNTRIGTRMANQFQIGYTAFRDRREVPEANALGFPTIDIVVDGLSYTTVGHEPFSINNILGQDVFQATNNFNLFTRNHVVTLGANYEQFRFDNSFNLFYYGLFPVPSFIDLPGQADGTRFLSLADFFDATDSTSVNFRDFRAEAAVQNQRPFTLAETNVAQASLYGQDEIALGRLRLTPGLRVDMPLYFTDVPVNEALLGVTFLDGDLNEERLDVSQFPAQTPLFSPRIGFNYAADAARTTQVRGGTGLFTGRVPFVWIGNQVANQGVDDPAGIGTVNVTDDDFRFPQVWKSNLAVDGQLPGGVTATLEGLYTKDVNAVYVRNANLARQTGTSPLDDRPVFGGNLNANVGGAYVIDNTSQGYSYSLTGQLQKTFGFGLGASLAYTRSVARDLLTSTEISQFLYEGNPVQGNPNTPELANSQFGARDRVIGQAFYRRAFGERFATSVGLVVEAAKGGRFSYVAAGDLNGDGVGGNDLLFVPETARDLVLVNADGTPASAATYTALDAFIEQDAYLSGIRGRISERNGALSPWFTQVDLRVAQDFTVTAGRQRNTIQLSLDVQNLGNLLNADWGVRQAVNTTAPLVVNGFEADGTPQFVFPGTAQTTFRNDVNLLSRWRAQFGVRYTFG